MPTSFLKSLKENATSYVSSGEALVTIEHTGRLLIGGWLSYQEWPITGAPFIKSLKMDCLSQKNYKMRYGTSQEQAEFAALSYIETNDLNEIMVCFQKRLISILSSEEWKNLGDRYQIFRQSIMKQFTHLLSCAFLHAEKEAWYPALEKELLECQENRAAFSRIIDKILAKLCAPESNALFPPVFHSIFQSSEWNQWKQNPDNFRSSLLSPALVRNGYLARITAPPGSNTLEERERIFDEISFISLPAKTKKMLLGNPSVKQIVAKRAAEEKAKNVYNKDYTQLLINEKPGAWRGRDQMIMTMPHSAEAIRHYVLTLSSRSRSELKDVLDNEEIWNTLEKESTRLQNEEKSEHITLMLFLKILHFHCRLEQSHNNTEDKVRDFAALLKTIWLQGEIPEIDSQLKHRGLFKKDDYYEGFRESFAKFYKEISFTNDNEKSCRQQQGSPKFCPHKDKIIETAMLWYMEYLSYLKTYAKSPMNTAEDTIFNELKKLRGNGIDLLLDSRPSISSAPGDVPRVIHATEINFSEPLMPSSQVSDKVVQVVDAIEITPTAPTHVVVGTIEITPIVPFQVADSIGITPTAPLMPSSLSDSTSHVSSTTRPIPMPKKNSKPNVMDKQRLSGSPTGVADLMKQQGFLSKTSTNGQKQSQSQKPKVLDTSSLSSTTRPIPIPKKNSKPNVRDQQFLSGSPLGVADLMMLQGILSGEPTNIPSKKLQKSKGHHETTITDPSFIRYKDYTV